ncbi:hypothetical protein Fmac_032934 [Flemingia macrophylla]|uniref:Uncharacterized protein n=1 Tax=Flemingia macrophylla TaxID=520843 RepID=A0ABD1L6S2_9FABA
MGRKWAANRQNLWNEFNDPTKSRDEIIKNVPIGIDKDQWARFVHYRHKPSTLLLALLKTDAAVRMKALIVLSSEVEGFALIDTPVSVWDPNKAHKALKSEVKIIPETSK